jgi:hypothetical protein
MHPIVPHQSYISNIMAQITAFEREQCSVTYGLDWSTSESNFWSNARLIRSLIKPSWKKERKLYSLSGELITDSRVAKGDHVIPVI